MVSLASGLLRATRPDTQRRRLTACTAVPHAACAHALHRRRAAACDACPLVYTRETSAPHGAPDSDESPQALLRLRARMAASAASGNSPPGAAAQLQAHGVLQLSGGTAAQGQPDPNPSGKQPPRAGQRRTGAPGARGAAGRRCARAPPA